MRQESTFPEQLRAALSRPLLSGLDFLRAVSAWVVALHHFGISPIPGSMGVNAFLVLSGFLITWLLLHEHRAFGRIDLKAFYMRRTLRILPAFYFYWALALLIMLAARRDIVWPQVVASATYTINIYHAVVGHHESPWAHTWSLALEEQFYLIWPVLFGFLFRRTFGFWRPAIAIIVLIWIWRAVLTLVLRAPGDRIYESFDTRFDHLLIGCVLAGLLFNEVGGRFWNWFIQAKWPVFALVGFLGANVWAYYAWSVQYVYPVGFILEPICIALIIPILIERGGNGAWDWLNAPWIRLLGALSYSTYLYQQLVQGTVSNLAIPAAAQVPLKILATFALAMMSYKFIERPFLQRKKRFERRAAPQ